MPSVGFEPKISEGERPKTYALDRTATGTGKHHTAEAENSSSFIQFSSVCICVPARAIPLLILTQDTHLLYVTIQYFTRFSG